MSADIVENSTGISHVMELAHYAHLITFTHFDTWRADPFMAVYKCFFPIFFPQPFFNNQICSALDLYPG